MLKTINIFKNYKKILKNVYFISIFKKNCSSVAKIFFKISIFISLENMIL